MMKFRIPETPNTAQLHDMHPIQPETQQLITANRNRVSEVLRDPQGKLFAGVGGCALTPEAVLLRKEAAGLQAVERMLPGVVTGQRMNTLKPRSNPGNWQGMESTEHEVAVGHALVTAHAAAFGNPIMELGTPEHVLRYGKQPRTIFGWIGARCDGSNGEQGARDLLEAAAMVHDLPLGIKNGLDGAIEPAVSRVQMAQAMRGTDGAPVVVVYRGGENARTPKSWEENYIRLWDMTGGTFVADCAHDSSTAHDPGGKKSDAGQLAALDHIIELTVAGYPPAGILMESSNTESRVDPNLAHDLGLMSVTALAGIKMGVGIRV